MEIIDELEPRRAASTPARSATSTFGGNLDSASRSARSSSATASASRAGRRRHRGRLRSRAGGAGDAEQGRGALSRRSAAEGDSMILVIDNYDSFTYNLVQYLGELGADGDRSIRNDAIDRRRASLALQPERDRHLARPGHARRGRDQRRAHPALAGACRSSASASATRPSAQPSAARSSARRSSCTARPPTIHHDGEGDLRRPARPFTATRYHSLVVSATIAPGLPRGLRLDRRRHRHGLSPPGAAGRRRAVPPRDDRH